MSNQDTSDGEMLQPGQNVVMAFAPMGSVWLKPDDPDTTDPFHQVFVVETKGLNLKEAADTEYKRSVFDICSRHATRRNWAEFVPAMRGRPMRFEVVDEAEWQLRLTELLPA